jgi:long-chain acyl-CoA synthetase
MSEIEALADFRPLEFGHGPVADVRGRAGEVEESVLASRLEAVGADDIATIVYTSGTTGPPKGCELTHRNVLATAEAYRQLIDLQPGAVLFMFLPLAHALARVVEMVSLEIGCTLAFWSGDAKRLVEDVGAAAPPPAPPGPRAPPRARRPPPATTMHPAICARTYESRH